MTDPSLSHTMPRPVIRKPRWVVPVVSVLTVLVVGLGVTVTLLLAQGGYLSSSSVPQLRAAMDTCRAGMVSDGDRTLFLDLEGTDFPSGPLKVADLNCVLDYLQAPGFVRAKMSSTAAVSGELRESWGAYEASWTYSPGQGLNVIIRQVD